MSELTYQQKYYKQNKEKINAYNKKWRELNKDKMNNYAKSFRIKNPNKGVEATKLWHSKNPNKKIEYAKIDRLKFPEKWKAREATRYAIKMNRIFKKPCCVCNCKKSEAHHTDYSKPLDVQWFCRLHHKAWHRVFMVDC